MARHKEKTAQVHGVTGRGPTVAEAKADARERIEQAFIGPYEPILIRCRAFAVLVWRHPLNGWGYALVKPPGDKGLLDTKLFHNGGTRDTMTDAVQAARSHLAQLAWDTSLTDDECLAVLEPRQRAEFASWVRFQRCYAAWRAQGGMPEQKMHENACRGIWPDTAQA